MVLVLGNSGISLCLHAELQGTSTRPPDRGKTPNSAERKMTSEVFLEETRGQEAKEVVHREAGGKEVGGLPSHPPITLAIFYPRHHVPPWTVGLLHSVTHSPIKC